MEKKRKFRIIIVGSPEKYQVGAHFKSAAKDLGYEVRLIDSSIAFHPNIWVNRTFRLIFGEKLRFLKRLGKLLIKECQTFRPSLVLATGVAPISAKVLREVRELDILTVNFLTDDPWNKKNGARFFWQALLEYSMVVNPRRANLDDLVSHGVKNVKYLPFGYNPDIHFVEDVITNSEQERFGCDVAIIGGGDSDRVPLARALLKAGYDLALYGGYWGRYPDLRAHWRGIVTGRDLRMAVRIARCNVCMGRRANRDGHAMRSIEFPAMGGCLVAEDTCEHRSLFGAAEESVLYWESCEELVEEVGRIVDGVINRRELANRSNERIVNNGFYRYQDHLAKILMWVED